MKKISKQKKQEARLQSEHWIFIVTALLFLTSVYLFIPSFVDSEKLPKFFPSKGIILGLDLQGGTHLVFEAQTDDAVHVILQRIENGIKNLLKDKKVVVSLKDNKIVVNPISDDVKTIIEKNYPDLTIEKADSETSAAYSLDKKRTDNIKNESVDQALEIIRNRVDQFGVAEPSIHKQGANEIVVQLPGIKDPKRAIELIGRTARLEFKLLDEESKLISELPPIVYPDDEEKFLKEFMPKLTEGAEILFERKKDPETGQVGKIPIVLKKEILLTGDLLTEAKVNINSQYNEPYVSLAFNKEGAKLFEEITAKNVNKRLAIILDDTIYSAPVIREKISGGDAQISGSFTDTEARDLVIVLKSGSLPAPLKLIYNVTVGPSLGRDSIQAGIGAGIIGGCVVVMFMIFYYKRSGLFADIALFFNIVFLLGVLAYFKATLTMPGIAGIVLAIGLGVDTNVLMFERIREELRLGNTSQSAIDKGYDRAFWTIVDSHVTTLITSAILYQFGTGPIKGFAVTLGAGVAINLYTALLVTKSILTTYNVNYNKDPNSFSI